MIAIPIAPGRLYRVRGNGLDCIVFANHPCAALRIVMSISEVNHVA